MWPFNNPKVSIWYSNYLWWLSSNYNEASIGPSIILKRQISHVNFLKHLVCLGTIQKRDVSPPIILKRQFCPNTTMILQYCPPAILKLLLVLQLFIRIMFIPQLPRCVNISKCRRKCGNVVDSTFLVLNFLK